MSRKNLFLHVALVFFTVTLFLGSATPSGNAAANLSAIPQVNVNEEDLSVQLFNAIFGQGWANLASKIGTGGDGSDGPTLIFALLGSLNSACAIAVAWIAIFTLLVGAVGAADGGKPLSGKSPFVPVRFAFSMAAIAPVFAGLNALQILILAGIGISIDMANDMWRTGVRYVATYGSITAQVPPRVGEAARRLSEGSLQSQTLIAYLARQSGCHFGSTGEWIDTGETLVFHFTVPQQCLAGTTNLQPGDLGGFEIQKARLGSLKDEAVAVDQSRQNALSALMVGLNPVALQLGEKQFTHADYAAAFGATSAYTSAISQGLAQIANHADPQRQQGLQNFVETLAGRGWFMAGSYYWIVADASATVTKAMTEDTRYIEPKWTALHSARILYRDWDTYVMPNLNELGEALRRTPADREAAAIGGVSKSPASMFNFIFEKPAQLLVQLGSNRPDALMAYSNTARSLLVGLEGVIGAAVLARTAAHGYEKWTGSPIGWVKGAATLGASSAGAGAAKALADSVFVLVLTIGLPLYILFWTFAYIIPAIPFIIWVAAIVGWIVLSIEAVVAAPLWLVGHAMPEGEGFAGTSGRSGYMLFFSVLLRPVLLVLSMFICMILMSVTGTLIHALFTPFMYVSGSVFSAGNLGLSATVALLIILGGVIAMLTWKMFELTTAMPDRVIKWAGQLLVGLGDEARGMGQQTIESAKGQGQNLLGRGGGALAERRRENNLAANQATQNRTNSRDGQHQVNPVERPSGNPLG